MSTLQWSTALNWLPSLLCLVVGVTILFVTFKHALQKTDTKEEEKRKNFFEKERVASSIRKQPIPESLFLKVDFAVYPEVHDTNCIASYNELLSFKSRQMVNLKGYTNLDLKEIFGVGHLDLLTNYERNYLEFMDISCKYAHTLYEYGYIKEAQTVLEYTLKHQCDLSKCYLLLAEIYKLSKNTLALEELKEIASLNMKGSPYLQKVLDAMK